MGSRSYPCNKIGCAEYGTRWICFGGGVPFAYCQRHFDDIFRYAKEYDTRDQPTEYKGNNKK